MNKFVDDGKGLTIIKANTFPVRVEASARLIAMEAMATELMARVTPVTRAADSGLRDIQRFLLSKDYQSTTRKSGALYYTVYRKEDEDGYREFEIVGWHGCGRYGAEKSILEMHDPKYGKHAVVNIGIINDTNINEANQRRVVEDIMHYLKLHA